MTKQRKRVILLIPALFLLVTIAFVVFTEINKKLETENDELPVNIVASMHIGYDREYEMSLSDMVETADVIVVGEYGGYDSSWNMSLGSKNYTEGHLYTFSVEEVLKGDVPTGSILVNQRYSRREGVNVIGANYIITVHDPLFVPPELDATYILFLMENRTISINKSSIYYHGDCEPFSIKIAPDNIVELQSNLIGKIGDFEEIVHVGDNRYVRVTISSFNIDDFIGNVSVDSVKQQIAQIIQSGG